MDASEDDVELAMENELLNGDGEDELLNGDDEYDLDEQDGDQLYSEDKINALLNDQEELEEQEENNEFKPKKEIATRESGAEENHQGHESEDDILELEDHGGHLDFDDEEESFSHRSEKFAVERAKHENTEEHSDGNPESVASPKTTARNKPGSNDNHQVQANVAKPFVLQNKPQSGASQNRPQQNAFQNRLQQNASQNRPQQNAFQNRLQQNASQNRPQQNAFQNKSQQNASQNRPQQNAFQNRPQSSAPPKSMQRPNRPQRNVPYGKRNMYGPTRGGFANQIAPHPPASWNNTSGPGLFNQPSWNTANSDFLAGDTVTQLITLLAPSLSPSFHNRPAYEAPSQASLALNFEPPPQEEPQRQVDPYVPPSGGPSMQPRPPFSSFDVPANMNTRHRFHGRENGKFNSAPALRHNYDAGYYPGDDQKNKEEEQLPQMPYFPHNQSNFSVPLPPLAARLDVDKSRGPNYPNFVTNNNTNRQFGKRHVGQNKNFANNNMPQQSPREQQYHPRRTQQHHTQQQKQQQQQQQQRQPHQQSQQLKRRHEDSSPVNAVKKENFQDNFKNVDNRAPNNPRTLAANVDMRSSNFQKGSPQPAGHTIDKQGYRREGFASPQGETRRTPVAKTSGLDEEASTKAYLQKIEEQKRARQELLEKKEERRRLRLLEEAAQAANGVKNIDEFVQKTFPYVPLEENSPHKQQHYQKTGPVNRQELPQKTNPVKPGMKITEAKTLGNFSINVVNNFAKQQPAMSPVVKTEPEDPKPPTGFMTNRLVSVKIKKNYNFSSANSNLKVINTEASAPASPAPKKAMPTTSPGSSLGGNMEGRGPAGNSRETVVENSSEFFSGRKVVAKVTRGMSSRLVVVRNLSSSTTRQKIIQLCEGIGQLTEVSMSGGQARIMFETKEAAHSFVEKYNRRMVDLSLIQVNLEPYL